MTLPPWMRVIQQSWTYHIVVAVLIGAGVSAFTCDDDGC